MSMSGFDWQRMSATLSELAASLSRETTRSPEEMKSILRQRAAELARTSAPRDESMLDLVTVSIGAQRFAFEASYVRETLLVERLVALPGVPSFIGGIVFIRGEVVSVVDLRTLLALPSPPPHGRQWVLVLTSRGMTFGVLADALHGIAQFVRSAIDETYPRLPAGRTTYIKGSAPDQILLIDAAALIHDEALVVRDED